jgi:S-adenosylmethionine:tRNA ribosyltransferase-isomerase
MVHLYQTKTVADPRSIEIKDYTYDLPAGRIAEFPMQERDQSKLLVYKRGAEPFQDVFCRLPEHLPLKSLMVVNDTRVIHARLLFRKSSGATIEIFCLNPVSPVTELQTAFQQTSPVIWECLVGNARRWKEGRLNMSIEDSSASFELRAERITQQKGKGLQPLADKHQWIQFSWDPEIMNFSSVIERAGVIPLPPYIHRESEESDSTRYQTIYASHEGSVAAPTAGLHFTPRVIGDLERKGIDLTSLTLHVGAGTFKPVTSEILGEHIMHAEPFEVSVDVLESMLNNVERQIVAVGTTTIRTLESLYIAGSGLLQGQQSLENLLIEQWQPYQKGYADHYSRSEILGSLVNYLNKNNLPGIKGYTRLLIAPPYHYQMVDGMITNFHQPQSTLLLLIAAFLGDHWREVYQYALDHEFRFLSYGDSCLFL